MPSIRAGSLDTPVVLFGATALFWGSGALVTTSQVAIGSPEPSVALRMLVLGPLALAVAWRGGQFQTLSWTQTRWLALQGVAMFGLAFIAFYHATSLIPSGLAALVLSTSGLFAALMVRLFKNTKLPLRTLMGLGLGLVGLGVIIEPQLVGLGDRPDAPAGMAWAALAALSTGGGALISEHTNNLAVPPLLQTGWGAIFGGLFALAATLLRPALVLPAVTPAYVAGLAYMILVASLFCFALFLRLIGKVGAASASYVMTLVPVVALALSALFEGYIPDTQTFVGVTAILAGNLLVLRR
ncbi:MAG: DMT family transporter [Devosia sp.]|nr:DMT family transporter [Devosia sp.]